MALCTFAVQLSSARRPGPLAFPRRWDSEMDAVPCAVSPCPGRRGFPWRRDSELDGIPCTVSPCPGRLGFPWRRDSELDAVPCAVSPCPGRPGRVGFARRRDSELDAIQLKSLLAGHDDHESVESDPAQGSQKSKGAGAKGVGPKCKTRCARGLKQCNNNCDDDDPDCKKECRKKWKATCPLGAQCKEACKADANKCIKDCCKKPDVYNCAARCVKDYHRCD